jgi:hypothetical protein
VNEAPALSCGQSVTPRNNALGILRQLNRHTAGRCRYPVEVGALTQAEKVLL